MTDELREAIHKVLEGFDQGVFMRNTAHDADSAWALRQLPYLAALGRLVQLTAYGYEKPAEASE